MNKNIEKKLKDLIVKQSGKEITEDSIKNETDLCEDIGFESFDLLKLIIEIEKSFSVTISDSEINFESLSNYAYLLKLVEEKSGEQ